MTSVQLIPDLLILPGQQLASRPRTKPADQILVHESVTTSLDATIRELDRVHQDGARYGVHYSIDPAGVIRQHAPLDRQVIHCPGHQPAIAVEMISPYCPPARAPWTQEIDAPWCWAPAGKPRRYVVPLLVQVEALAQLIGQLVHGELANPHIPPRWIGLEAGGWMRLGADPDAAPTPGIWAHHYQGGHADGAWPVLYAWLRIEAGLPRDQAYAEAIRRATKRTQADVLDLMRAIVT